MLDITKLQPGTKLYFLGIGGISMSALALILNSRGFVIRGYDRAQSEVTDGLEEHGVNVDFAFDGTEAGGCGAIVYSAAFGETHPVLVAARKTGIPMYSRAELLGGIAYAYKNSVAVAGTHGKSTTSGMLGHIFLNAAGCDPTVIVGAVMRDVGSTYRLGGDGNFIFEACEYRDSFLSFFPRVAVVLNVALDHTDYFKDIGQMRDSFTRFMNNAGRDGYAVYNLDCENSRIAAKDVAAHKITFSAGGDESADYYAKNVKETEGRSEFDVYRRGEYLYTLKPGAPGRHNVANSLAAAAVCDISGISAQDTVNGIAGFTGVGRRFEYLGGFRGARVYDDYAHHPDEIKATLATAREIAGEHKVFCVFQPHNYSRLRDLYGDFITAFGDADKLILCPLYAAREKSDGAVSSETLAALIDGAEYYTDYGEITARLEKLVSADDIVIIMGAGDISKYAERFKK
ncbi:MAG: UDP-N-acetylmuramate--L-alanine ligase [Clostridia bacterium]|nr:UDP-N-acetylmuramate--L-alanine ligase [Clostridia bacterium]